jgi:hypothetical protein
MRDFEYQRFLASPGWHKQHDKKQGFGWTLISTVIAKEYSAVPEKFLSR